MSYNRGRSYGNGGNPLLPPTFNGTLGLRNVMKVAFVLRHHIDGLGGNEFRVGSNIKSTGEFLLTNEFVITQHRTDPATGTFK